MGDITDVDQLRPSSRVNIFTNGVQSAGTYTQLLNMSGYKTLQTMFMITPYLNTIESTVSNTGVTGGIGNGNAVDANLTTFENWTVGVPNGDGTTKYDLGSNISRKIAVKYQQFSSVSGNQVLYVSTSPDDVTYTNVLTSSVTANGIVTTFTDVARSVRYVKIRGTFVGNTTDALSLYEVYDSNLFGGSISYAKIEIFEPQTSTWLALVDLGTPTVTTLQTVSNLPNTSTDLRVKVIQTGSISGWGLSGMLIQ